MAKAKQEAERFDVHLILQGKGGVGKSVAGAILTEYLRGEGQSVLAVTTDPVNQTLVRYESLGAKHHEIMGEDEHIDGSKFDDLVEEILSTESNFVIDNGATTFLPLLNYMQANDVVAFLEAKRRRVIVHNIICAGVRVYDDSLKGFERWAGLLPDRRIVLWINEYFGALSQEKVAHEEEVQRFQDKVLGIISLPVPKNELAAKDVKALVDHCLQFSDAEESPVFKTMNRHRLGLYKEELFGNMRVAFPVAKAETAKEPVHA